MTTIQLQSKDGTLYYPETVIDDYGTPAPIVLRVYDEGDCDTIKWPRPHKAKLQAALRDDVETGLIPSDCRVLLPSGIEMPIR